MEEDDIIIDGGNEWWENSERRAKYVQESKKLRYMAMGVSGGEEGARNGARSPLLCCRPYCVNCNVNCCCTEECETLRYVAMGDCRCEEGVVSYVIYQSGPQQ